MQTKKKKKKKTLQKAGGKERLLKSRRGIEQRNHKQKKRLFQARSHPIAEKARIYQAACLPNASQEIPDLQAKIMFLGEIETAKIRC